MDVSYYQEKRGSLSFWITTFYATSLTRERTGIVVSRQQKTGGPGKNMDLNLFIYSPVHLRYISLFLVNSLAKLYSDHDTPCGSVRIRFAVEPINDPAQDPFSPESDRRFVPLSVVWVRKKTLLKALFSEYWCQVNKAFTYQSKSFNTRKVGRAPSSLISASLTCLVLQKLSLSNQFYLNNL